MTRAAKMIAKLMADHQGEPVAEAVTISKTKKDRHRELFLQTRVPLDLYEEVKRRAVLEKRDVSNFLKWWLERTFAKEPMKAPR